MAADTAQAAAPGTLISTGSQSSVITLNESNNLKLSAGKVAQVIVWGVGTAWVIDVYDDPAANNRKVWSWVTADGKGVFALQMPMSKGIRVVTSGTTAGSVTVVWA